MDKLILKQTNIIETVNSEIIEKIKTIVSNTPPPLLTDLKGVLSSAHAYEDTITYLNANYPKLVINITDGKYIRFEDKEVEKICAENWGDEIGITAAQAASVSSVGTTFKGNISITSFDELQYLKVNGIASNAFNGCTSLKTIHLPDSCTNIGGSQGSIYTYSFIGCTSLEYVYGAENVKIVNGMAFSGCSKLKSINLKNVETLWESPFEGCASLISIGDLSNITCLQYGSLRIPNITSFNLSKKCKNIDNYCFAGDINLESVGDLSGVENIGNGAFSNCTALKYLKFTQTVPPSIGTGVFNGTTFNIYVQDTCVDTYKNATNWSTYASRIFSLTQFAVDFPNN